MPKKKSRILDMGLDEIAEIGHITVRKDGSLKQTHYQIPDNLAAIIKAHGRKTKANVSGFAAILLSYGLKAYLDGDIDHTQYLGKESDSNRYFYEWDFEKIDKILQGIDG